MHTSYGEGVLGRYADYIFMILIRCKYDRKSGVCEAVLTMLILLTLPNNVWENISPS